MKKTLIALAVLAASGAAFAQSTATISGSISVGVMDTGLAGAKAAVFSLGGGANGVSVDTVEDLGGGLKGGFASQIRFNASSGDRNSAGTGNALFHNANAYVSGAMGTARIGKIAEDSNCGFDPYGCTGGAGLIAGASGTISGLIAAQTQAQSVRYESPTVGGFSVRYQTTVSTRANERSVLNLGYANGPLAVQFLQSKGSLNVGADVSGTAVAFAVTDAKAQGTSIGASYDLGVAKLAVFNAKTENAAGATTADITGYTAAVPMGAVTLLAGFAKNKSAAATADTKMGLGANYALSKRTTVGADVFKQDGVGADTGFVARIRHTF
jgi:predicted porin